MACKNSIPKELELLEIQSNIRGYHAYRDSWTPVLGETLSVKRETTNPKDKNAVAVHIVETIVGHVPYNIAYMSRFLKRDVNIAYAKVTGGKINRGAGYGLEISCIYRLYGPREYIGKMKEIIDSLKTNGFV